MYEIWRPNVQFGTFTKNNIQANFCNEFSKYIEAVCKHFWTWTILQDNKISVNPHLQLKTTFVYLHLKKNWNES